MAPAMKVDEVELNYVFVPGGGCPPPGAGLPSPLPVSVPESLLHRPSAHLRASIIESLRGEGTQVEQRELRFWKPKRPLKASDVVSDLSTWFLGTGDGERRFIAMALTESPLTSFGERIRDQSLVHLVVTSGKAPYILEPPSPGPSNIGLTPPLTITIGTEAFPKHGKAEKGERYNYDVSIVQASSASRDVTGGVPAVLLGIYALDANSDGGTIQLISHVSNLHPDGFRMYVDSGKDNTLYGVHLSWMAISPSLPSPSITTEGIQCGVADSHFPSPQNQGCRRSKHRVNFRWTYEQPPEVFACLAGLTTGGDESPHRWDIRTYVTNIDRKGFVLNVERVQFSDPNKAVAHAQVSWMAFPYGGTADLQLACGEVNMEDGTQVDEGSTSVLGSRHSLKGWQGELTFAEKFTSPPQVFSAFTSFELPANTMRMIAETENVTKEGMEWKIGTWIGGPARSATMAFLAIGRR
ncbi:hypothetical protein BKA70DRAFT_1569413 [Coprinopsis sp. MPI-PUGE-AT-0042]|nr:hypothetical protein BKA70DRAFT_1569413 [Coprinopsis sp. MPI-PUGE-AT-0042]